MINTCDLFSGSWNGAFEDVMMEADVNSVRKQYIYKQDTTCVLKNEWICK